MPDLQSPDSKFFSGLEKKIQSWAGALSDLSLDLCQNSDVESRSRGVEWGLSSY